MAKQLRVLQVLGGLYSGGTEAFVMNMYRSIDHKEVVFDFLIHDQTRGHYDDEVIASGGNIYRIPDRTEVGTVKYLINLVRELKRINPDVVHAHAMFNSGAVMLAAYLAGIKKRIAHSHNTADQSGNRLVRKMFRSFMRWLILTFSTDLAACGREAARYLYGSKAVKMAQPLVFNNAVNVENYKYDKNKREEMRKDLGIEDELVFGHIGRFNDQKNHRFLLDIFHRFHLQNPKSVLLLIGEGPLQEEIKQKVTDLGLTTAVRFLGLRNDIHLLMQAMDVFLLPSIYEGFPFVLVEAQAAGLYCVVSDVITRDVDVTGRVRFISLQRSQNDWVKEILRISYGHEDTSEVMKIKGYDSITIARNLVHFYRGKAVQSQGMVEGSI